MEKGGKGRAAEERKGEVTTRKERGEHGDKWKEMRGEGETWDQRGGKEWNEEKAERAAKRAEAESLKNLQQGNEKIKNFQQGNENT